MPKPRAIFSAVLCIAVFAAACLLFRLCTQKPNNQAENTSAFVASETPGATRKPRISPNGAQDAINWMGHWYKADKRYDLVLEIERNFAFLNQETKVNLQFPEQISGTNNKVVVAHLIAEMIKHKQFDWDIVWMDNLIYQFVADELNDPFWGRKHLVDFEEIPGFVQSQKPFITQDPGYRNQTGGILVGPYIEGYYYALYYNRDLAAKMGIQVKPFGMTFEDLLGYVKAADRYNQNTEDKIPIFFDAYDMPSMEVLFQNLVKSWIDDYTAATAEQSGPRKLEAMHKGFQAFEELGKYRPLISSYAANAWFLTRDVPLNDKALFYISGTWMYNRWRDIDIAKSSKMIPAELPVFKPVDYCLGGFIPAWAVMKDSPTGRRQSAWSCRCPPPRLPNDGCNIRKPPQAWPAMFPRQPWAAMCMRLINEPCPKNMGAGCNIHLMPHTCLARKTLSWKKILWMFSGNCWKGK